MREASAPRTLLCLTLCSKRLGTISKSSASKATEKRARERLASVVVALAQARGVLESEALEKAAVEMFDRRP